MTKQATARRQAARVMAQNAVSGSKRRFQPVVLPITSTQSREPERKPQTLTLEDFPQPALARALSPNGRAHWATKKKARETVEWIVGNAIFEQRLTDELLGGQVRITYRWVFPDRRRRDLDNHSTGVVKSLQDCFVRVGLIDADDTSCVVGSTTEITVERGRRALVVTLEPAATGGE